MVGSLAVAIIIFGLIAWFARGNPIGKFFGALTFLSFIAFLFLGPGPAMVGWLDNPSGPSIPDNIPLPGVK